MGRNADAYPQRAEAFARHKLYVSFWRLVSRGSTRTFTQVSSSPRIARISSSNWSMVQSTTARPVMVDFSDIRSTGTYNIIA